MNTTTNSLIDDWMSNIKTHNKNGNVTNTANAPAAAIHIYSVYIGSRRLGPGQLVHQSPIKVRALSKKKTLSTLGQSQRSFFCF